MDEWKNYVVSDAGMRLDNFVEFATNKQQVIREGESYNPDERREIIVEDE